MLNDNNFPGGGGRGAGVPDPNELILIRLDRDLEPSRRVLSLTPGARRAVRRPAGVSRDSSSDDGAQPARRGKSGAPLLTVTPPG